MCKRSCHTCKYKKNIPGDAHFQCAYPLMDAKTSSILSLASIANPRAFNQEVKRMFGFTASEHGLQSGWFSFPSNFSPTWMEGECNKHSDLVDEAVVYQLTLNERLQAFYELLSKVEKGEKSKDVFKEVIDSYNAAIEKVTALKEKENLTDEDREAARNQLIKELGVAHEMLKQTEKDNA